MHQIVFGQTNPLSLHEYAYLHKLIYLSILCVFETRIRLQV